MRQSYSVVVEGTNWVILMEQAGGGAKEERMGFFATRIVQADNAEEAKSTALEQVRTELHSKAQILNQQDDAPQLHIESVHFADPSQPHPTGFTFYPDE